MENLALGTSDSKLGVLVDKALSTLFKCFNGLIIPPVSVVSTLVVVPTGGIESYEILISYRKDRSFLRNLAYHVKVRGR